MSKTAKNSPTVSLKNPDLPGSQPQGTILWIIPTRPALADQLEQEPIFQGWAWIYSRDALDESALKQARLVLVNASLDSELEIMRELRECAPSSIRVLVQDIKGSGILRKAVNRGEVFSIINWPLEYDRLKESLREAVTEAQLLDSRLRLLKESTRQNRELEKLTASLESLVEERTHHIQISKEFEEEKVSRIRGLIRFIQELSGSSSFEDLIDLLRRDLRSFHQVHDPVLIYEVDSRGPQIVYWRNSMMQTRPWPHAMAFVPHIHLQDPDMSKKLANYFARPFGKALVIPIDVSSQDVALEPTFQLVLENSLPEGDVSQVLDFCLERLQPFSTAIERLRMESELTHFSYRWEKTFDGLKDPIAIIDRSDRVLRSNKKFSDHLIKDVCYKSFAGRDERCEGCPVPQVLMTGQAAKGEIRRNGRLYEVYSYPISLVPGGKPTNVVNQYVDQTQAREIYMRLLQSEKMGALGLLAGNIAHELNNPLTGLRSLAQVLRMGLDAKTQTAQDLNEIEKASERCQKIIRNLLDFVNHDEKNLQSVHLDDLVEKTLPFLKTAMRFHRLNKELTTAGLSVRAEPQLLQQVIFNLVHNACQAMEKQGILTIETEDRGAYVRLWVRDTGPGVPEAIKGQIFEPFFTTKREGSGTGLGLSLSKEIVESFSGKIGVDSFEGKGASFWFELPRVEAAT